MATVSALLLYTAHRTHVCRPDAWARYTEAINLEPGNHLAHSNRSACFLQVPATARHRPPETSTPRTFCIFNDIFEITFLF